MSKDIISFRGDNLFLSNFYKIQIVFEGDIYASVEHAYQASKTFNNLEREIIRRSKTGEAKLLGQKVQLRSDWEQVKIQIMTNLIIQKFNDNELKEKLLSTKGSYLKEGNDWHDNFWGSCYCSSCGYKGENLLGVILMEIRSNLL